MKKLLALALLITLAGFTGCASDENAVEPKSSAPAAAAKPTTEPDISYSEGFSELEQGDGNSWRWMAGEGVIKLKNSGRDMRLHLAGDVPMGQFKQPPTIKVVLNGEQLDSFTGAAKVDKEYTVPAAKLSGATSELRIITDKVFVPKEVDKKSTDGRKLGFSLTKLEWVAK